MTNSYYFVPLNAEISLNCLVTLFSIAIFRLTLENTVRMNVGVRDCCTAAVDPVISSWPREWLAAVTLLAGHARTFSPRDQVTRRAKYKTLVIEVQKRLRSVMLSMLSSKAITYVIGDGIISV